MEVSDGGVEVKGLNSWIHQQKIYCTEVSECGIINERTQQLDTRTAEILYGDK